jgi:hypothetical protein
MVYLNTVAIYWGAMVIYCGILTTIENVSTVVNYYGIFITLAPKRP